MKWFSVTLKRWIKSIDPVIFIFSTILSIISILTIFGSVENFGRSKLVMQVAMTIAGMVAVFIIANLDYRFFVDRFYIILFVVSVLLLGITLIFGISGQTMETGNKSWLTIPFIGISIQPSEFVKIAFLCTFSKHIDMIKDKLNHPLSILGLLVHAGVLVGLILLSGDLGVALIYFGIIIFMLYCAGVSGWYFLFGGVLIAVCVPFLWEFLKPYQLYWHPLQHPQNLLI